MRGAVANELFTTDPARQNSGCKLLIVVRPARLERATSWFVARRSIQLSYGRERCVLCTLKTRTETKILSHSPGQPCRPRLVRYPAIPDPRSPIPT
jgi:hypothetical protein